MKEHWGCEKPTAKRPVVYRVWGREFSIRRCPRALLRGTGVWEVFRYYNNFKNGFLPEAGGINDQPGKLMQAIDFISGEMASLQAELDGADG